jgi:hypothetical protein
MAVTGISVPPETNLDMVIGGYRLTGSHAHSAQADAET